MKSKKGSRITYLVRQRMRPWLLASAFVLCGSVLVYAAYFQGFETNTFDWTNAIQVPSGTNLVTSKTGAFHAEDGGGAFTRWSGYSETFPVGGYTTSIDIYLDIAPPYGSASTLTPYNNDTRFDWTSAINNTNCQHRRDFVFNAGFYTDTDTTGSGPRFVISASNNGGIGSAFPKNPDKDPFTINAEGWYTFEHRFYGIPPAPGGQLSVDLTIKNFAGVPLHSWTLTNATDIIGTNVGGNRYGWFPTDEFPFLAFDNSVLLGFQDYCVAPPSTPGAKITGGGWIDVLGGRGTFGLTARASVDGTPSGNLTYQDHSLLSRTVKSTSITSVVVDGDCARINGTATVNGSGAVDFQTQVCDNGEPGNNDTFSINMSDGYSASGTLRGGNIQIH